LAFKVIQGHWIRC